MKIARNATHDDKLKRTELFRDRENLRHIRFNIDVNRIETVKFQHQMFGVCLCVCVYMLSVVKNVKKMLSVFSAILAYVAM